MTETPNRQDNESNAKFPAGIPYIVGNEGAERFSYYGMRAILYVYLVALFVQFQENLPEAMRAAAAAEGTKVTHLFFAGVYLFPLIGAILSDRLFGKYRVIIWLSLVYCAGHAVLAVAGRLGVMGEYDGARMAMYLGLTLIAVGSGGIKPCVSANVGDQFTAKNSHLVTKVFQIFYFMINFGSFFSTLITPFLYKTVGPEVAFGVPGILMGLATVIFWMGRRKFVRVPPTPGGRLGMLDTIGTTLLFTPIFALIIGYFAMWEHFQIPEAGVGAIVWAALRYYWVLLLVTAGAFALGLVLFFRRQRIQEDKGFLAVMVYSIRNRSRRQPGQGFFDVAREKFGDEAAEGPPAVLRIMLVFSMVSMFWALFDQHASTWVEQARHMNLDLTVPHWLGYWTVGAVIVIALYGATWLVFWLSNTPLKKSTSYAVVGLVGVAGLVALVTDVAGGQAMSIRLQPAQLAALNPLMVMMIIPLLNVGVWGPLGRRGIVVSPLRKMTIGMFLAAIAFGGAAFLQFRIEAAGEGVVHGLWQAAPYVVMTTAEVLVSVTGLEFAYTQAPRAMKSTIMGFWLLCVTLGNLIVAFLAPLQQTLALSEFFWLFTALMAGAAVVFAILAGTYKGKTYLQQA